MPNDNLRKEVFTVIDKGDNAKGWWVRVGTAFVNRDGSLSVVLDALPVNGRLQIRDPLPKRDGKHDGGDDYRREGDGDHGRERPRDTRGGGGRR